MLTSVFRTNQFKRDAKALFKNTMIRTSWQLPLKR